MGIPNTPNVGPSVVKHPVLETASPATMIAITAVIRLLTIANPFVVYAFLKVCIVISYAELADISDDSGNSECHNMNACAGTVANHARFRIRADGAC